MCVGWPSRSASRSAQQQAELGTDELELRWPRVKAMPTGALLITEPSCCSRWPFDASSRARSAPIAAQHARQLADFAADSRPARQRIEPVVEQLAGALLHPLERAQQHAQADQHQQAAGRDQHAGPGQCMAPCRVQRREQALLVDRPPDDPVRSGDAACGHHPVRFDDRQGARLDRAAARLPARRGSGQPRFGRQRRHHERAVRMRKDATALVGHDAQRIVRIAARIDQRDQQVAPAQVEGAGQQALRPRPGRSADG